MIQYRVDLEALDARFRALPVEVRNKVARRALAREMRKVLGVVRALYSPHRTILPRMHLKDSFLVKTKVYAGTVWSGVGVLEGQNPKGHASARWQYSELYPGWRFGFIERNRRIRGGPGAGRGGRRLRSGAIPLYTVLGKRHLDKAQRIADVQVPQALSRELARTVRRG